MELYRFKKALNYLAEICNRKKQKEKYQFIGPLRKAGIQREDAKSLGFKFSNLLWKSSLKQNERSRGKNRIYL
jgi:hypothetical protein